MQSTQPLDGTSLLATTSSRNAHSPFPLATEKEPAGLFHEYDPSSALPEGHAALRGILDAGGLRLGGDGFDEPGASVPTVARLYRAAGPNEIPFSVDTWKAALQEEFATFFFLYQFSIYAVCLWFSYWHYTLIARASEEGALPA
ncbi:unnamed protein product, partial [Prorocentrum cordatum]